MVLDLILNKINNKKSKKSLTKRDFLYFDNLFKNCTEIINNKSKEGDTLLHSMVFFNCYDLVYLLLKNGAVTNVTDIDNQIPLYRTIFLSDKKILKLLLKKSNNLKNEINYQDKDGNTPLHLAVLIKNYTIINLLLKYGADPYIMNNANIIPLDLAKDSNKNFDIKIIEIFKNYIE
jgi:ankyrin repeat protein